MQIFHENLIIPPTSMPSNHTLLTDQNLYHLCQTYGSRALEWRRKFTGLLPEVNKRRLFEKKGFPSIFVFAYKLAGLSEKQVRLALNLEKKFKNLPILKSLLLNSEVSVNKLIRIASIVNLENEEFLANQVKILSSAAIETLVRDTKWTKNHQDFTMPDQSQNGLLKTKNEAESLHMQTFLQSISAESNTSTGKSAQSSIIHLDDQYLHLSPEVQEKLLNLQQKGLDVNKILLEFLQKREIEIAEKKEEISKKVLQREQEKQEQEQIKVMEMNSRYDISEYILQKPVFLKAQSRPHVPVAVKKILHDEYGTKCAVPNCQKYAENLHHTLPFSIGKTHNPKFIIPLCKAHHELEHAVNLKYQKIRNTVSQQT